MRDPWAFQRWAFERVTGNVGRKTVLMALASMADTETGRCEAKHETLARWAEVSRRSIIRHIEALREAGLLATRRQYRQDGSRRGDEYLLLAPWVEEWPDGQSVQSATVSPPDQSANGDISKVPNGAGSVSQLSQQERPLGNDHLGTIASSSSVLPDAMRADVAALLGAKRKVDRRLVSEEEMAIAGAALAEFNRQMESDYGLGAHLTPIVMRIRERPGWDAGKHVRLVQSAWRLRWGEKRGSGKRPTPAVVYGTSAVFEQVAQDAADEASGRQVTITDLEPLKRGRYSGGRSWDELTRREQEHVKRNFVIGRRPGERSEARPIEHTGKAVTAETWLDED